jgi:hypothetical protein
VECGGPQIQGFCADWRLWKKDGAPELQWSFTVADLAPSIQLSAVVYGKALLAEIEVYAKGSPLPPKEQLLALWDTLLEAVSSFQVRKSDVQSMRDWGCSPSQPRSAVS